MAKHRINKRGSKTGVSTRKISKKKTNKVYKGKRGGYYTLKRGTNGTYRRYVKK